MYASYITLVCKYIVLADVLCVAHCSRIPAEIASVARCFIPNRTGHTRPSSLAAQQQSSRGTSQLVAGTSGSPGSRPAMPSLPSSSAHGGCSETQSPATATVYLAQLDLPESRTCQDKIRKWKTTANRRLTTEYYIYVCTRTVYSTYVPRYVLYVHTEPIHSTSLRTQYSVHHRVYILCTVLGPYVLNTRKDLGLCSAYIVHTCSRCSTGTGGTRMYDTCSILQCMYPVLV